MTAVVTGATGFIGQRLVRQLAAQGQGVRALSRGEPPPALRLPGVDWVQGDLGDPAAWDRLLEAGATVYNLAYSFATVPANATATVQGLVEGCSKAGVRRLVHASTVSVYGRAEGPVVTEATACRPHDGYGRAKLAIERAVAEGSRGHFECAIVRPATVFGEGGIALEKDIAQCLAGPGAAASLRASLFGARRMHLVAVDTVAAALAFAGGIDLRDHAETFIVSEDDEANNNFADVRRILREELGVAGRAPSLRMPRHVLETILRLLDRPAVDTRRVYSPAKLRSRGFQAPVNFENSLREYARGRRTVQSS